MAEHRRRRTPAASAEEDIQPLNREQKRIMTWLRKVRFKKKLLGGVNERDVWKKIGELNAMYDLALLAERARYDALLQQQWEAWCRSASADTNSMEREGG